MKLGFLTVLTVLFTSNLAHAAASLQPMLDSNSYIVGTLVPFKFSGADPADVRRYEVEGALPSECRVSRDAYYPDVFQLKCTLPKSGLRLKMTVLSGGVVSKVYSDTFSVRDLRSGGAVYPAAAMTGSP